MKFIAKNKLDCGELKLSYEPSLPLFNVPMHKKKYENISFLKRILKKKIIIINKYLTKKKYKVFFGVL
jgi:hypothetical protein